MNRLTRIASAVVAFLVLPASAFAAEAPVNPGVRIGEWLYTNVTALFAPILAIIALYFLAKRQFTQFISFAVFAVLVSLFVFAGSDFKDSAVGLAKWIIGR